MSEISELYRTSRWYEAMDEWHSNTSSSSLNLDTDIAYCQAAEALHLHVRAQRLASALLVAHPTNPAAILNYKTVFRFGAAPVAQVDLIRDSSYGQAVKALEAFQLRGDLEMAKSHFNRIDIAEFFLWPIVMEAYLDTFWTRTDTDALERVAQAYTSRFENFAPAQLFYANVLEMQEKYREAEQATMRSIALMPTMKALQFFAYQQFHNSRLARGKIASTEQALSLAKDAADRMLAICGVDALASMQISQIYLEAGEHAAARKMLANVSAREWERQHWQKSGATIFARVDMATDPSNDAASRVIDKYLPAMLAGAGHRPQTYQVAADALKRLGKYEAEREFRRIAADLTGSTRLGHREAVKLASSITLQFLR